MQHVPGTKYLITISDSLEADFAYEGCVQDSLEGAVDFLNDVIGNSSDFTGFKVMAFYLEDGTCRDVSEDLALWAAEREDFYDWEGPRWLQLSNIDHKAAWEAGAAQNAAEQAYLNRAWAAQR